MIFALCQDDEEWVQKEAAVAPRVSKGQCSWSTSRACNLVGTSCVINLNIIGTKARITRIMMNEWQVSVAKIV